MYCPYCGTACADTHNFCYHCGNALPDIPKEDTAAECAPVEAVEAPAVPEAMPISALSAVPTEDPIEETPMEPESEEESTAEEPAAEQPTTEGSGAEPMPATPKKGRIWPPVLFLLIMFSVGLAAFLGSNAGATDACFTVENGTLYFDYTRYTGPDELTVPAEVNGMTVTAISEGCFRECDRLTTVILPDSVTVIGDDAFSGCDNLRGIYIPESVMSIGASALAGCSSLEAVYFPESIQEVGEGCLDRCDSLRYIFYGGTYRNWMRLYQGTYPPNMELHTSDGTYYAEP